MRKLDAVSLLVDDHVAMCRILEHMGDATDLEKRLLWQNLQDCTSQYLQAEAIVVDAIDGGRDREQHAGAVDQAVADLVETIGNDRMFHAAVESLMNRVAAHADYQENSLFPQLRQQYSSRQLRLLGTEILNGRQSALTKQDL